MELKKYTVGQMMELDSEEFLKYWQIGLNIEPVELEGEWQVQKRPYTKVKEAIRICHKGDIVFEDMLNICTLLTVDKSDEKENEKQKQKIINEWSFVYFFGFIWRVLKDLGDIQNREMKALGHIPDADEIAAGVDRLNKYGYLLTLKILANNDIEQAKRLGELPYFEIFTNQLMNKDQNDVHNNLIQIKSKKRK